MRSIRASQLGYFKRLTAADAASGLTLPDLVKVGEAYGMNTVRIRDPKRMREDIRAVLAAPGPVLCDVVTIADEPREPRVSAVQKPDGTIVSRPLEDMVAAAGSEGVSGEYDCPAGRRVAAYQACAGRIWFRMSCA